MVRVLDARTGVEKESTRDVCSVIKIETVRELFEMRPVRQSAKINERKKKRRPLVVMR